MDLNTNEKDNLVLSIDYGTQSVRALIFNKNGELLAKKKIEFVPYFSANPGWAEQYAHFYWDKLCEAIQSLKSTHEDLFENIIAMSVTTFRDSHVCVDKDGNALRPIILWLDQRLADCSNALPQGRALIYKIAKMYKIVKAQMKASHSNWIKENEPELWSKTYKYLTFSGYITYRLTGSMTDSIACQIGHIPINSKKRRWMTPRDLNYYVWDIPKEKMPDTIEPGEIIGYISKEISTLTGIKEGIPVIASGTDKGCETVGSGCVNPNTAAISFGTAATIQLTLKDYVEPLPYMPAYPAVIKDYYNSEIQVYRGYWMISWFKKEFALKETATAKYLNISAEELLNQRLNEIPPGSDGLILQPYWGPTLMSPEGKGAIIGFSDVHTRVHIYKAIIEGIGYALRDGLKNMEKKSGAKVNLITVSGGGSQSDAICQLTADMFGISVARAQTYETSGLGTAINTFVAMKVYKDIPSAINKMVRHTKIFKPNLEIHKLYDRLLEDVYCKMYKNIQPMYKQISDILNDFDFSSSKNKI